MRSSNYRRRLVCEWELMMTDDSMKAAAAPSISLVVGIGSSSNNHKHLRTTQQQQRLSIKSELIQLNAHTTAGTEWTVAK